MTLSETVCGHFNAKPSALVPAMACPDCGAVFRSKQHEDRDRAIQYELQNFRASVLRFIPLLVGDDELLTLRETLVDAACAIDSRRIPSPPSDDIPHASTGQPC